MDNKCWVMESGFVLLLWREGILWFVCQWIGFRFSKISSRLSICDSHFETKWACFDVFVVLGDDLGFVLSMSFVQVPILSPEQIKYCFANSGDLMNLTVCFLCQSKPSVPRETHPSPGSGWRAAPRGGTEWQASFNHGHCQLCYRG